MSKCTNTFEFFFSWIAMFELLENFQWKKTLLPIAVHPQFLNSYIDSTERNMWRIPRKVLNATKKDLKNVNFEKSAYFQHIFEKKATYMM